MSSELKSKLSLLPHSPGCYLFKNKNSEIIYVGKSKNLKSRVNSYFNRSLEGKTLQLVSEIIDFEVIVTNSNVESLLLEINLIKQHNPRYNIMLKDDKTYPFIKITNEKYPQLIITRKIKKDGGKYFGPYPNTSSANEVLKLLNRIYPLRKCNPIPKNTCLYYHLGQCLAPCINDIPSSEFTEITKEISSFLNGNCSSIKSEIEGKMISASEKLDFESAKEYRDQILHIENIMEKQKINLNNSSNKDVFGYSTKNGWMCVQVFFVRQGNIIERDVSAFPYFDEENDVLMSFIAQFYSKDNILPKEIVVPSNIDENELSYFLNCTVSSPSKGKNFELLKLADKNASLFLENKFNLLEKQEEKTIGACKELANLLGIEIPFRIEAFDNSHLHGTNSVSAMVTFINGKPSKKDYRKYKLKNTSEHDDYAAMHEVLQRRYSRLINENNVLPDLIIIDGGKGQLEIAHNVINKELSLNIPIISLVKNEKHKTDGILFGKPIKNIDINKRSDGFYLLERIQDEVHRFAVSFLRQQHSASTFKSELDRIEGLGPKRREALLNHFGSIKKIKEATIEELCIPSIPKIVAENIFNFFKK